MSAASVAPRRGAWIETHLIVNSTLEVRRAPAGRVD